MFNNKNNTMEPKKRSFFERLTGSIREKEEEVVNVKTQKSNGKTGNGWMEEESEEAELAVDVYQTPTEIVLQTMVAGVRPEDIELTITRDMVTIVGKREEDMNVGEDNYFAK